MRQRERGEKEGEGRRGERGERDDIYARQGQR